MRAFTGSVLGRPLYALVANKFYVDELYHWTVVTGLRVGAAASWFLVDRLLIDWTAVDGTGRLVRRAGSGMRRLHAGSIAAGAALIAVGTVLILRFADVSEWAGRFWLWMVK